MSRLSLFLILSIVVCVSADYDVIDGVLKMQPLILKRSSHCPIPIIGHSCPKANEFTYFKCCGELNKDCCETFQTTMSRLSLFLILSIVACV
ncbi:hypothetical protein PMAYCL1PPCAC_28349, partial [Pristionchus mayeri]